MALPFVTAKQADELEKEINLLAEEVEEHQSEGGTFLLDLDLLEPVETPDNVGFWELTGVDNEALFTVIESGDLVTLHFKDLRE